MLDQQVTDGTLPFNLDVPQPTDLRPAGVSPPEGDRDVGGLGAADGAQSDEAAESPDAASEVLGNEVFVGPDLPAGPTEISLVRASKLPNEPADESTLFGDLFDGLDRFPDYNKPPDPDDHGPEIASPW
jgi:hypothetical protein